jgi:hypothetical protein
MGDDRLGQELLRGQGRSSVNPYRLAEQYTGTAQSPLQCSCGSTWYSVAFPMLTCSAILLLTVLPVHPCCVRRDRPAPVEMS